MRNDPALAPLLFLMCVPLWAEGRSVSGWEPSGGPPGGAIFGLVDGHGSVSAETADSGTFCYRDGGRSWRPCDARDSVPYARESFPEGCSNRAIRTVRKGAVLIAGLDGCGIYRSPNDGRDWSRGDTGPEFPKVRALAAVGEALVAGIYDGGVLRSLDTGRTWAAPDSGPSNRLVTALAVRGGEIFAGTDGGGVFRSLDAGAKWAPFATGLPGTEIVSLASTGVSVYAAIRGRGVFRLGHRDGIWRPVNEGLANPFITALLVHGENLYAGTDGFGVWRLSLIDPGRARANLPTPAGEPPRW